MRMYNDGEIYKIELEVLKMVREFLSKIYVFRLKRR